jgi:hypothetical protein
MKIYIVCGETGEYEGHYYWNAKAFIHKQAAEAFMKSCQLFADSLVSHDEDIIEEHKHLSPDPCFYMDYTGAAYAIEELELITDEFTKAILENQLCQTT